MPNISDDMDTQNICVSEAKASGMMMHARVLYVQPTYTQAALHNESQALGAPLSVANPGLGQGYYTAGIPPKIPAYAPEPNTGLAVSSLSTGNTMYRLAFLLCICNATLGSACAGTVFDAAQRGDVTCYDAAFLGDACYYLSATEQR